MVWYSDHSELSLSVKCSLTATYHNTESRKQVLEGEWDGQEKELLSTT